MKLKMTTRASAENEGARKIDKGRIGYCANLYSHTANVTKRQMLMTSSTISYGLSHPTAGAWLLILAGTFHKVSDTYFQTKLKRIRPLIPRMEPIQSIGSEWLVGCSGGSRSAILPKTINPSMALSHDVTHK